MDTLEKNFIFIWKPIETTKSTIKIQWNLMPLST
jgi:hypothetical protein